MLGRITMLAVLLLWLGAALPVVAGEGGAAAALYNRYAEAVRQQPGWALSPEALAGYEHWPGLFPLFENPLTLPDSVLAQWEGEYAAEPCYWQLRAYCAAFRHCRALNAGDEPDLVGGAAFLREAWRRGAADAETLLLLHTWEGWAAGKPLEREQQRLDGAGLGVDYRELAPRFEQEELKLLGAATELGPDECWPHWRRAIYWLFYGEPELGLADLVAGNAALSCRYPVCFPVSFAYDELAAGRVAGDKALAGLLIEEAAHYGTLHSGRDTVVLRERYKEAVVIWNMSGDSSTLAELYRMAARLGLAQRRSLCTSYESANLCSLPASELLIDGA